MKQIALLFSLFAIQFISFSQEKVQGIVFQKMTFNEAIQLSKQTGKPIFIDAYTVWCGPCKYMEKKVFTNSDVANYFNTHFINLKVEMEKDAEGPELARKYRVTGYPTMLFIDGEEKVIKRQMGAVESAVLIDLGKSALK